MPNEIITLSSTLPSVTFPKVIQVVQYVANGDTVKIACEKAFISVGAFKAAVKREPHADAMLQEALQIRDDILADILINIDKEGLEPRMAGVVSKNIQWVLERSNPSKFGQRLAVDVNGEQSKTLAAALNAAIARIPKPAEPAEPLTLEAARKQANIVDIDFEEIKTAPPVTAAPEFRERTPEKPTTPTLTNEDELRRLGFI